MFLADFLGPQFQVDSYFFLTTIRHLYSSGFHVAVEETVINGIFCSSFFLCDSLCFESSDVSLHYIVMNFFLFILCG